MTRSEALSFLLQEIDNTSTVREANDIKDMVDLLADAAQAKAQFKEQEHLNNEYRTTKLKAYAQAKYDLEQQL